MKALTWTAWRAFDDVGRALAGAGDLPLASWLPVLPGLTPHGLRHGRQTWMDEDRIADVLKSERMGHEVPGMRGVYLAWERRHAGRAQGRIARALGDITA